MRSDGDGGATPKQVRAYQFRFRAILVTFVLVLGALGALGGYAISLAQRVDGVADTNRGVSCAWLEILIDNPPSDPTPDQAARFAFYRELHGAGVAGVPGLRCDERGMP